MPPVSKNYPLEAAVTATWLLSVFLSKPSKEIQQALSTIVISNTRLNQDHSNINSQTWAKLHDFKLKVRVFQIYSLIYTFTINTWVELDQT